MKKNPKKPSKITLVEEKNIKNNKEEIAKKMKKYFVNVTKDLILKEQFTSGNDYGNDSHINIK